MAHDEERRLLFFCLHIIPPTISYLVNRDILKMSNWGKVVKIEAMDVKRSTSPEMISKIITNNYNLTKSVDKIRF